MKNQIILELRTYGIDGDGQHNSTREYIGWQTDDIDPPLCAEIGEHAQDLVLRAKTFWDAEEAKQNLIDIAIEDLCPTTT